VDALAIFSYNGVCEAACPADYWAIRVFEEEEIGPFDSEGKLLDDNDGTIPTGFSYYECQLGAWVCAAAPKADESDDPLDDGWEGLFADDKSGMCISREQCVGDDNDDESSNKLTYSYTDSDSDVLGSIEIQMCVESCKDHRD